MVGVYIIKNTVNGKYYVGSSVCIESRWKQHIKELSENIHNNKHLQNAWNKYGKDNFIFEVLEETDKDILRERETYYLELLDCVHNGYNMLNNASFGLGVRASEVVRKKISKACSGSKNGNYGRKHTQQELIKMRENRWGKNYVCKPKVRVKKTEEELKQSRKLAGDKIRKAKLGTHLSDETKQKLREIHLGKHFSDEVKSEMSKNRKGSKNANCKLTKEMVLEIYEKMNSGVNYKDVCKEYGIGQCWAYKIKRKEHWAFNNDL